MLSNIIVLRTVSGMEVIGDMVGDNNGCINLQDPFTIHKDTVDGVPLMTMERYGNKAGVIAFMSAASIEQNIPEGLISHYLVKKKLYEKLLDKELEAIAVDGATKLQALFNEDGSVNEDKLFNKVSEEPVKTPKKFLH